MKKFIGVLLCLLFVCLVTIALADVEINVVNFPDDLFREYIRQFDTNNNGILSDDELSEVKVIDCHSVSLDDPGVTTFKGIEFFTKLWKLECYNDTSLKELDVSKNTELTELVCDCTYSLSSLDVSHNTKLERLDANYNQLTSLDVSHNTALKKLYLTRNQITSLDVSNNTLLESLYCDGNQLTSLDVSWNTELKWLICDQNCLTNLDVSSNTKLTNLGCTLNQLSTLDVRNNTALEWLYCGENLLQNLDVSQNAELTEFWCMNSCLQQLDISHNTKLKNLWCFGNRFSSLDVSNCAELVDLVQNNDRHKHDWQDADCFGEDRKYGQSQLLVDANVTVIAGNYVSKPTEQEEPEVIPVSQITLNKAKATLTRTSKKSKPTLQLTATVQPTNATNASVEWTSSNTKVAKVNKNGKVTALKKGTAVITCKAKDGSGVKTTCKITVKDKLVTKVKLNKTEASLTVTISKKDTLQLKATVSPSTAVNTAVSWKSSNKKVATVNSSGKVTAVGSGSCTITATAKDGSGKKATCKITVTADAILVDGLKYKLNHDNLTAKLTGPEKTSIKTVKVPATVKANGKTYKVTVIGKEAFKGYGVTLLSIGKNITTIEEEAFSVCTNLTDIELRSASIKKIGKNAFKGIKKKVTIYVAVDASKSYIKKVIKWLKEAGIASLHQT